MLEGHAICREGGRLAVLVVSLLRDDEQVSCSYTYASPDHDPVLGPPFSLTFVDDATFASPLCSAGEVIAAEHLLVTEQDVQVPSRISSLTCEFLLAESDAPDCPILITTRCFRSHNALEPRCVKVTDDSCLTDAIMIALSST